MGPVGGKFTAAGQPFDINDSAGRVDYTRKNEHSVDKRKGAAAPARQVSDSTNTSSRFFRSDGNTASTSRNAAIAISVAESGRVRNTVQSPREISSARRRFSSISGPSTIPSSSGAGSKSCLISQYPSRPNAPASTTSTGALLME